MPTISFKLSQEEAMMIRERARQDHITLSEFLRRQALAPRHAAVPVGMRRCALTGATIFDAGDQLPPLTVEATRDMLTSFP